MAVVEDKESFRTRPNPTAPPIARSRSVADQGSDAVPGRADGMVSAYLILDSRSSLRPLTQPGQALSSAPTVRAFSYLLFKPWSTTGMVC